MVQNGKKQETFSGPEKWQEIPDVWCQMQDSSAVMKASLDWMYVPRGGAIIVRTMLLKHSRMRVTLRGQTCQFNSFRMACIVQLLTLAGGPEGKRRLIRARGCDQSSE